MSNYISKFIAEKEAITPTLENQRDRFTYITFLPVKVNTSYTDEDGVKRFWFQIVSSYTSNYQSINEDGEVSEDNATLKTLTVKFPMDYVKKHNLTATQLKKFFEDNFVNKKFITLPVSEESPVFEFKNNARSLVKNHTQVTVSDSFNLEEYIKSFDKPTITPKETK